MAGLGLVYNPSTSAELTAALLAARPGDLIQLLPIEYVGQFTLDHYQHPPGVRFLLPPPPEPIVDQNQLPITLRGSKAFHFHRQTTIVEQSDPNALEEGLLEENVAIQLFGGKWIISDLTITTKADTPALSQTAVQIESDGHLLQNITFEQNMGGVVILGGNDNRMENLTINNSSTGIEILWGQRNSVKNCTLNGIKENGIRILANSYHKTPADDNMIESTHVRMDKNYIRKKIGIPVIDNQNRPFHSLEIDPEAERTLVKKCSFDGVTSIPGDKSRFEQVKFL